MPDASRLGPKSIEAEEAVLGSALINPACLPELMTFIEPGMFFELKHAKIWETMQTMYARGMVIDNLTLAEVLRDAGLLADYGGPAYLTYLINSTPTHIYAETYGRIVEVAAIRRRIMKAAGEIAQVAREKSLEIDPIIAECEALLAAATKRDGDRPATTLADATDAYFTAVETRARSGMDTFGFPSGLRDLDYKLGTFRRGGLYLIAARPGVGKTTLLLNIARNMVKQATKVLVLSLEMAKEELIEKIVSAETFIPSDRLQKGQLDSEQWARFVEAGEYFRSLPLFLDDSSTLTPSKARVLARRQQAQYGLDCLIVDYIQLMEPDKTSKKKQATTNDEVASISKALKHLARELNVPVLAACQLNRAGVGDPGLHNLRDSGALEADADGVILLSSSPSLPTELRCNLAKHRHGQTGSLTLHYKMAIHHITSEAKAEVLTK